jgi:hypothetical protein
MSDTIYVKKGFFNSSAEIKEQDVRSFKLSIKANKFLFFKPKYEVLFYDVHDEKMKYEDYGKMKNVVEELLKVNEPSMVFTLMFVGLALNDRNRKARKLLIKKIGQEKFDELNKNNNFRYEFI